ncbi:hypothetical protein JMN32_15310 [Fulvivirga sp. 29W222]|uniref:DUF5050 domain-containing protein n=1 Tax=Fulvivirga marina TaxID=2494733 RepID=A0A937FWY1_9BACT|nr:hypothetical protein [Fulvivirga marina]MBL6447685.1 hypothetical protein [Fulvivirga marina]
MSKLIINFLFATLYAGMGASIHAQTLSQETFFESSVITDFQVGGDNLYFAEINYQFSDKINIKKLPNTCIMSIDSMLVRDMGYNNETNSMGLLFKDYNNQFYLYNEGVGKLPLEQQILDYGVFNTLSYSNYKGKDIIFGYLNETLYWYSDDKVESLTLGEEIKGATVVGGVFFLCSFDGKNLNIYSLRRNDLQKRKLHSVKMDNNIDEWSFFSNGTQSVLWYQHEQMITKLFIFDNEEQKNIDIEGHVHHIALLNDRYYFNISYFTSRDPFWQIGKSDSVKSSHICNIFSADLNSMVGDSKWTLPRK